MFNLEKIENDLQTIDNVLASTGEGIRKKLTINEEIEKKTSKIMSEMAVNNKELDNWEKAKILHGLIMAEARSANKADIVSCVDGILKNFYGDEYSFDVEFSDDGALDFIIKEEINGKVKTYYVNGDDSAGLGGGLSDTISTALRIMLLLKSGSIGPLLLDEAYRQLDSERACKVGDFLKGICEEYGVQIIMATHLSQVAEAADMKIMVEKVNKKSIVTCEEN